MKQNLLIGGVLVVLAIIVVGLLMSRTPRTQPESTVSIEENEQLNDYLAPVSSPETTSPAASGTPSVSPTPTTTTPIAEKTISIDDTGFMPTTLTVPAGTKVTFVNNGQGAHWPASDVHPTHQLLPGFDAKRGLATGETYSFTFTTMGSWKFHDHLNPQLTGNVVVQ